MNLPNQLTVLRIILIPVCLVLWGLGMPVPAAIVFALAAITDFLDGYIARKQNIVTTFGKFADPVADKILVLTAMIFLTADGILPAWAVCIVAARELMVDGLRLGASGKGNVIADGKDVAIFATGIMNAAAIEAREQLKAHGIDAAIIDIHTIKPIDEEIIMKAAAETKAIITAEEHSVIGGLGAAVAEVAVKKCPVKMAMVGVQDRFGQSGKPPVLMEEYNITAADIVKAVKETL